MMDLELVIGKQGAPGQGGTEQMQDGTWLAWAFIAQDDLGLYGAGPTEAVALEALGLKIKALGNISAAAYSEADSRYKVRKLAKDQRDMEDLRESIQDLMEGIKSRPSAFDPPKKKDGDGEN